MNPTASKYSATNIIIAITIICYFIQTNIEYGSAIFGLNYLFLKEGFYHQILTTMFTHGGLGHLGMNMFVLYQFGNLIEHSLGVKRFLIIYLIGGLLTSIFSFIFMYSIGFNHNLVGASGAISVLMGFIAMIDKTQRKGIVTWVLVISVAPLLIGLPIAWYAHFIGLAFGFLIAFMMIKKK